MWISGCSVTVYSGSKWQKDTHQGKKANWEKQYEALGNVLLGNLSSLHLSHIAAHGNSIPWQQWPEIVYVVDLVSRLHGFQCNHLWDVLDLVCEFNIDCNMDLPLTSQCPVQQDIFRGHVQSIHQSVKAAQGRPTLYCSPDFSWYQDEIMEIIRLARYFEVLYILFP